MWNWRKTHKSRHERMAKSEAVSSAPNMAGPEYMQDVRHGGKPQLVEEGKYYGRPVRLYSDGSVKAATGHGWVRFNNMDALQEYEQNRRKRSDNCPAPR